MSDEREFTTAELTAAILRTVAKESERERRELGVDRNPRCCDPECLRKRIDELERENAALREAGHLAEEIIAQRTNEIRHLERENAELRKAGNTSEESIAEELEHTIENLRATLWGTEFELEKAKKQIDGLYAELASSGAEEVRQTRAENHQISQKASKLCYDLIAKERELEKANAALDWLNTHCMSADPIMGRSTYRWTIEHDEPDIRAAIAKLRKAQA